MKKETRDKILDVTYGLCNRYGFWSLKVEDILNNAGISRATFYKYFKSVNDVLDTLFDEELNKITLQIREAVDNETETFDKLSAFMLTEIIGIRKLFLLTRFDELDILPPIQKSKMYRQSKVFAGIIEKVLAEGIRDGALKIKDMSLATRAVMSLSRDIGGSAMMEKKSDEEIEAEIKGMLKLLFNGLLPR